MPRSLAYLLLGVAMAAGAVVVTWLVAFREYPLQVDEILAPQQEDGQYSELTITYPLEGTLFPPEIVPPIFRWTDGNDASDAWAGMMDFANGEDSMRFLVRAQEWTPSDAEWEAIKRRSLEKPANLTLVGLNHAAPEEILSRGHVSISTSEDEVAAPIFYREVNLPFREAVRDPAAHIRWRFGAISCDGRPPTVLEKLPVCGNCHSFSADAAVLGMDVDYANEKGSYATLPVGEEMTLDDDKIFSWDDYRREDGEHTFGLLSQVSPDGRYVVSTVKDRSVFVPRDNLAFSQLFFPLKGILVVYDRKTERFRVLPGADDRQFVQSNPTWSPDGKYIVFARQKAYEPKSVRNSDSVLLTPEECHEFLSGAKTFQYDLFRVPFNGGEGGEPESLAGASNNGMSNYFPKYSPDGKWIVFCKAKTFMLLQPDSELYIIPAEGGKARRLRCNTRRMNSWHSWAPNGKWLVFSSKANSAYTQLFLTHIDEAGQSTPAVLLSNFTAPEFAANIPEFVNAAPDAIKRIRVAFLNDRSYFRAAYQKLRGGDFKGAEELFRKTLKLNPEYVAAHFNLAVILLETGRRPEAMVHCQEALRIDPECFEAHLNLARGLQDAGDLQGAAHHFSEAVRLKPNHAAACYHLGLALQRQGKHGQAVVHYARALEEAPNLLPPLLGFARLCATSSYYHVRDGEEAIELATKACQLTHWQDPLAVDVLAAAYATAGRFPQAVEHGKLALGLAHATGNTKLADAIEGRLQLYERRKPFFTPDLP